MATKAHSLVSIASRHPITKYEYANAAARTGATGFGATDLNAVAHQQDNDTYWILIDPAAPGWLQLVTGAAAGFTAGSVAYAGVTGDLTDDGVNFSYAAGIVTLSNGLTFTGGGTIATTANGDLTLLPNGTGITKVGTGSSSQGLSTNDDLYIKGKVEIDNRLYCDFGINMTGANLTLGTNIAVAADGAGYGAYYGRNTYQGADCTALTVGTNNNYILVAQDADRVFNFAHPIQTDPTIFLHSSKQNTTEWGSLCHNQTDFVIDQGAGTTKLAGGISHNITDVGASTYDLLISDYVLHVSYTGTGAVTSLTLPTAQTVEGRVIHIKDSGGNSSVNNITIDTEGAQTIDGSATLVLNTDYAWVSLYCDGSDWFAIGG